MSLFKTDKIHSAFGPSFTTEILEQFQKGAAGITSNIDWPDLALSIQDVMAGIFARAVKEAYFKKIKIPINRDLVVELLDEPDEVLHLGERAHKPIRGHVLKNELILLQQLKKFENLYKRVDNIKSFAALDEVMRNFGQLIVRDFKYEMGDVENWFKQGFERQMREQKKLRDEVTLQRVARM